MDLPFRRMCAQICFVSYVLVSAAWLDIRKSWQRIAYVPQAITYEF